MISRYGGNGVTRCVREQLWIVTLAVCAASCLCDGGDAGYFLALVGLPLLFLTTLKTSGPLSFFNLVFWVMVLGASRFGNRILLLLGGMGALAVLCALRATGRRLGATDVVLASIGCFVLLILYCLSPK